MSEPAAEPAVPTPSRLRTTTLAIACGAALAALVALLVLRLLIVRDWHVPAGDGLQYYRLAYELRVHHRFAFGPPPAPLTYARLPGYPLFVALLGKAADIETHLVRATLVNQALDVVTALFVMLIAFERRLGTATGVLASLLVLACPIVLFLSCYGLTESLTTCLVTGELYFAVRAMRRGSLAFAALSGALAGLAQLVRPDAVAMVPAALAAIVVAAAPLRRRLVAGAVFAIAAAVTFSPWPLRNHRQFGAFHATGAVAWQGQDGSELPTGMLTWMRTWASGEKGETYLMFLLAWKRPIDLARNLRPEMFDDEAEKQRVIAAFEHYNRHLVLADANGDFLALARDRTRRAPLRTYVTLPLKRVVAEWSPVPEWELPMRARWAGLPAHRADWNRFEKALFALSILGAGLLWRRDPRLLLLIALAVVVRTAMFAYGIPFPVERYMVEVVPALLVSGAVAMTAPARLASGWLARPHASRLESTA